MPEHDGQMPTQLMEARRPSVGSKYHRVGQVTPNTHTLTQMTTKWATSGALSALRLHRAITKYQNLIGRGLGTFCPTPELA